MEKTAFQIGGKKDYSTNGAGTFGLPSEKKKIIILHLISYSKITSRWIKNI